MVKSTTASTPNQPILGRPPSSKSKNILPSLGEKRGSRILRREQEPAQPQPRDEKCSTEVAATIAVGCTEGITRSAWKSHLRSAQQVLTTVQGGGLVASSLAPSPSPEGGTNSTCSGHDLHLRPADARPRSGAKPQNSCFPENLRPELPRPCVDTRGNKPLQSSAFRCRSHPPGECLGHCYFLLGDLWGIRGIGADQILGLN
ncbi:hypothetical protein Cgig2_012257 [Carnegiea gigantea]|uniref:Uncharacterized protein n=1 Tax=Carnegiea gigantea TaxID=171969 RepID=A0A9Q1K528_9CARY|nr:hypothetical protein Cgig2_012257 [Carnegiea gigantea]